MSKKLKELTQNILLNANRGQPTIDFLIEVAEDIVSFLDCDTLEIWLNETNACSRWKMTRQPRRLFRAADISSNQLFEVFSSGLLWTNDGNGIEGGDNAKGIMASREILLSTNQRSMAAFPMATGEDATGVMIVRYQDEQFFDELARQRCSNVAQILAIAVTFQRVRLAQKERVKELTCLYEIGKANARPEDSIDDVLQRIVNCLPPAWQYPEITWASIKFDGRTFATAETGDCRYTMSAPIEIAGRLRGSVEVIYGEEKPDIDEGPFLREERKLIDLVGREVSNVIEQKEAKAKRANLQEQLQHADRLATIGQLAAGVAHELNEPLGSILGFAQLAKKHPELPLQTKTDLEKIEASSLHAREVIRKLMVFARQAPPDKIPVALNQVVEEGTFFFDSRCLKMDIRLKKTLQQDLPDIIANPAQLNQVLINLVVNAIQAMPDGGELEIVTQHHQNRVELIVSDTGLGMSKETLKRIFDPFFSTKDIGEGTGLGLAVVHGIVVSHRGQIRVTSEVGEGTSFVVEFPAGESMS